VFETRRRRRSRTATIGPSAPTVGSPPVINGTPTEGVATSYTAGGYTGVPTPTLTRQWTLDGVDIGGATGLTYTPVAGDVGHLLRVRETATNGSGSVSATSDPVVVVAAGGSTFYLLTRAGDRLTTRAGDQLTYR
jgi:hypothetical protein